jgi:hypothetical protein
MKTIKSGLWYVMSAMVAAVFITCRLCAQSPDLPKPPPVIPPKTINSSISSMTNPPLRTISPGVFEMGSVRIDKPQRSISFPAELNMNRGLMEYFLVTDYGKTHESVLRTKVAPYNIHVAMLLLGAKGETNQLATAPQSTISNPSKKVLPGNKISIAISWTADGKEIRHTAEELIFNQDAHSVMKPGEWVYNGSAIWSGTFLAQREGSIASLVTDPSALINYTGPGHDNDHIWTLNTNSLPPFDLPLQVTVRLEENQK